ncbi:DUF4998 domain-containing protein [Pseudochryseolinea flava]|nr:DUF4998 domain-containing protein [Pseudochryseolinea flava]
MNKILLKRKMKGAGVLAFIGCVALLVSCSDWDEFKKYTKDGEIVYPGKFDSVAIFPGKERVRVWGTLTADPKIKTAKIFWDNNKDSAEFEIDGGGTGYIFDEIVDIGEGVKSFVLHTYDANGNKSVGASAIGVSYGDRYRNTLSNRRIKSIAYDDAATTIIWDIIDVKLGPEAMEVHYETPNGDTIVRTPANAATTVLPKLDYANDGFLWKTIYRPLAGNNGLVPIDTFSTPFTTRDVPVFVEKELDRSNFKEAFYTGDTFGNGGAGGIDAMWDGQAQNSYGGANFTDIGTGGSSPQMITFDLGMNVDVTQIKIYPFLEWWGSYYVFSTIRDYEIYGASNPSSNGALDESWTLLASGTFAKPSGQAKDQESDADKDLAKAGFVVNVDPDAPKVKYIRIRCLKNYEAHWNNASQGFFSIAEIKVSGMLPQ